MIGQGNLERIPLEKSEKSGNKEILHSAPGKKE